MKDVEPLMEKCELAKPSAKLDENMARLFAETCARRPRFIARPIPLWQCAVVSLLFAACGFVGSRFLSRTDTAADEAPLPLGYAIPVGQQIPAVVFDFSPKRHPHASWLKNPRISVTLGPEPGTTEQDSKA